ncbi:BCCT family transporter, partial [Siminovitchia fortis]|uniref:BCCT family transporter n=1 Tax=Siminovitchia fortis TaxID=254758 RepID=UPI001642AD1D
RRVGFGGVEINGGVAYVLGMGKNLGVELMIIVMVRGLFVMWGWCGVSKGMKYLRNRNMIVGVVLSGVVLILGGRLLMLNVFRDRMGSYV